MRCVRPVLEEKNLLFMGADSCGDRPAGRYSLIGSCKLGDVDPEAHLRHVLTHISDHVNRSYRPLLPLEPGAAASDKRPLLTGHHSPVAVNDGAGAKLTFDEKSRFVRNRPFSIIRPSLADPSLRLAINRVDRITLLATGRSRPRRDILLAGRTTDSATKN